MLHLAQDANRHRFNQAREELAKVKLRPLDERYKSRKKFMEENASQAGVVTINQVDADYIELNLLAYDTLGASFSEFAPVQIGQAAIYKTRSVNPIRVNIGSLAGGPPQATFATNQNAVQVQPFQYFADEQLVPNLVNVNFDLGKFDEKQKMLERMAHDMLLARQQFVINMMLQQPLSQDLATSITAYAALSAPWNNRTVWVPDSQIQTGALPTTNFIDFSATEGGVTRNVMKGIRTYTIKAHRAARSLFIPVAGAPWEAYWDQASIVGYSATGQSNLDTSRAIPPSKWEEAVGMAFELNGAYMNWFGMNLFVQPVDVLPAQYCLLATDAPAVLGWDMLEMSVSAEQPEFKERMMSHRYEARGMALAQPDSLMPHFALLKIGTGG